MRLNKRGNTTKEQEKMQGFLGESVVAVKAAKKKAPTAGSSRKFNKNSSKGPALTLKNSKIIKCSRVTKERSYCIWHWIGKREPRAATSNEPSPTEGVKPCGD